MPLLPYVNRLEPVDDAAIWRYPDRRKFRDLIASEELCFRRAYLFTDKSEGLPPEQYVLVPGLACLPGGEKAALDLCRLVELSKRGCVARHAIKPQMI